MKKFVLFFVSLKMFLFFSGCSESQLNQAAAVVMATQIDKIIEKKGGSTTSLL